MWKNRSPYFEELRDALDQIPLIDSHQHYLGVCQPDPDLDLLAFLATGYHCSDLHSAAADFSRWRFSGHDTPASYISDRKIAFEQRFKVFEKYWNRMCHTSYARALSAGLEACWGLKNFHKRSLLELQEKMRAERNQQFCDQLYRKHKLSAMVVNSFNIDQVIDKRMDFNRDVCRFVFNLPEYHNLTSQPNIRKPHLESNFGRPIISLDDYLDAVESYLKKAIDFGIVGIKDQTAYRRQISYENVSRGAAEAVFNRIIANPRDTFSSVETLPLDNYLFHEFMKMAARYNLPVQVHTGHMAGIRNEIAKTNPVHLTGVLELHSGVTFDLFHGGWPYMGEYLFLGKNYPNVNLDMCWCNAIDPLYSVELFKRAVMTVPHTKVSGFGGDCLNLETHIGYLVQARDNIAIALSELIDCGWLDQNAALQIGEDWLYNNPKRLFAI